MDYLGNFAMAFNVALEPTNLVLCFVAVLIGTAVGVLPGLGPTASISILLPITFGLTPVQAIIMLSGIYYGAMYGGSTTSILVNIPGEAASVVTCLDGYQMARKGRAGPALGISAIGSYIGGTFGVIMLMFLAVPLSRLALKLGTAEFVSLAILGLTLVTYLSSGSMIKALMMALVGLLLGYVGLDIITGRERFTLGVTTLAGGFDIIPLVMGLFGISEVLLNIEKSAQTRDIFQAKVKDILPTIQDWKDSAGPITRGSILGLLLGVIPGGGALMASFASYAIEKRIAKHPEKFGTGDIRGVAGPETANNSGAQGAFIPLVSLGIPSNSATAILMGALMIHGITPGPRFIGDHPQIFWGLIGSMYLGNAMLLILNLPLIALWVKILDIPYRFLFPLIFLFCLIGAYAIGNNILDVFIMIVFGIVGYLMKKYGYEPAPLVLAFVLGPILEVAFRQSLIISHGSFMIFVSRPVSAVFLFITLFLLVSPLILKLFGKKRPGLLVKEEEDF